MNEEVNFCNQCGSKINSDAKFCSNCGCDLKNSSTKTSLDANIKLETANVKLETTNATLEKGIKATGATLEKGVKATGATLEKGFKEVRKGLLLSTERVMGFSFKSGLTRIWIFLSVLYLIFATVALIENIEQYANIGTMVGNMLGGLILLWLVPYILIFWIGRGLYWALCWIKTGFIADPSNKPDQSKIRTKEEE
ncbi:MAG: zinc ribbon domain-containing protein [Nitrospina sp.]|nr:zinc ribbon domain-containing protein [Nitrospina sp.]